MTQGDFVKQFEKDKPIYKAWGEFVTQKTVELLAFDEKVDSFLKIPPYPRVKEMNSLLEKAYYRNKNYKDPYNCITDKVGTRFVVLLSEHITKIKDIIEGCKEIWSYSLDRDYEEERKQNPSLFEYQSVHYIVRNINEINYQNIIIPRETPCEIQIRTLVQHAYSELTHDTIYKPNKQLSCVAYRKVARSMALIESTDELFSAVNGEIEMLNLEGKEVYKTLYDVYSEFLVPEGVEKLNLLIYDSLKEAISQEDVSKVREFILENPFIKETIRKQYSNDLLYRQPIVLLIYYLIGCKQHLLIQNWPLTLQELQPLFTDLGVAMPH